MFAGVLETRGMRGVVHYVFEIGVIACERALRSEPLHGHDND